MQVDTVDVSPESANHMIVSLNGVIQKPTDAYTVSGSTITFASALETGDVIDFIQILGNVLDLGVPSVSTAKIVDANVTTAKILDANVTAAKMFSGFANGITEADQWRLTTSFTGDAAPIASNWERTDTSGWGNIGTGMTQASGIFTFPSTGVYLVSFNFYGSATTAQLYCTASLEVTVNNSSYVGAAYADTQFYGGTSYNTSMLQYFVDVTDVSTHKVRFVIDAVSANTTTIGSSTNTGTGATFIRLGAT
jgi:hypothetical protein